MTNKRTIILQIITLLPVSTLSCHPQGECNQYLAKSHKYFNLSQPTGYMMHQQFNIQQLYALPTLYLCVLYLSENKQRLVSLTA